MRCRLLLYLALGSSSSLVACSSQGSDCEANKNCGAYEGGAGSGGKGGTSGVDGSGGTTGGGGSGGDGTTCDPLKSPSEDACVIDEAFGVFVSPTGSDATGDGSKTNPFKTLGDALNQAKTEGKRVYACADGGSYAESLTIDTTLDGLELFGGFRCADWTYSTSARSKIQSSDPVALNVKNLINGLRVEDFEVTATDAAVAGSSSFAAIVEQSQAIVLRRVRLVAGSGADGAPGQNGVDGAPGAVPGTDQNGKGSTCGGSTSAQLGGGWPGPSGCGSLVGSLGGTGGTAYKDGTTNGGDGTAGIPKTNVTPPNVDNGGPGATSVGINGSPGTPGSNGNIGSVGAAAKTIGTFTSAAYQPADGNAGVSDGFPGQGGGGGGAAMGNGTCVGASGGAGGLGGCGGTKGTAGGGGGASVALLSWQSAITLDTTELIAANGGNGGNGGDAGRGGGAGSGAVGGAGNGLGKGGDGGSGGNGGPGGSGSGGTGGPSFALVWNGTPPTKVGANTLTAGLGGTKGVGGAVQIVAINKAPDGSNGTGLNEYEQM